MTFRVLILLCTLFFLGKSQELLKQPEFTIDESIMNLGPSTVHSIKGKFYEEKQRPIVAHNKDTKLVPGAPGSNIASQLHNILSNISNTEPPRQGEKILFRRKKGSSNNTRELIPHTIDSPDAFRFDVPKESQMTQANNPDSTMLFKAENVVSSYDKNNTFETIKKELAFDSLLIKNDFNKYHETPTNIMNSYTSQEINHDSGIVQEPVMIRVDQPYRRLETNQNYESMPRDQFQMPIMDENNFAPIINYGRNDPNDLHLATSTPSRLNKPIIGENNVIPITPKFEPINYDNNVPKNINIDTREPSKIPNNYNVIDKSTCDDKESDEILERSGSDIQLKEPTKGLGITNVGKSRLMLLDHPRVCYACSSINDPSCWLPDRTTSVKYCRADHPSCLTKLYKYKGLSYIIRDCGNTCEQNILAGGPTKYTACTICHHDLCNSAHHFEIQKITILMLLIFILLNVSVN